MEKMAAENAFLRENGKVRLENGKNVVFLNFVWRKDTAPPLYLFNANDFRSRNYELVQIFCSETKSDVKNTG